MAENSKLQQKQFCNHLLLINLIKPRYPNPNYTFLDLFLSDQEKNKNQSFYSFERAPLDNLPSASSREAGFKKASAENKSPFEYPAQGLGFIYQALLVGICLGQLKLVLISINIMLYNIMPLIIILFCLAGIVVIYCRKIPYVAGINVQELPKEQQAVVKKSLIERRIDDKIKTLKLMAEDKFSPIFNFFLKYYHLLRNKIKRIEEEYKQKHIVLIKKQPQIAQQKVLDLLNEGEKLIKENNFPEAEKRFIEAISLNPNNIESYRNLGQLYLKQKNFHHAKETFEYILKLITKTHYWWGGLVKKEKTVFTPEIISQIAFVYLSLGEIHKALKNNEKALENYRKAAEIEPNNPRNLDFLIETAIILKKKEMAKQFLQDLKKVNSDNEKIKEFEMRLKEL